MKKIYLMLVLAAILMGDIRQGPRLAADGSGYLSGTREFGFILGADTGSALADTDDQPTIFRNSLGRSITITEVWCESDGGTPAINLQKDDGSAADVLSSNLSCSTSGATSTSFTSGENVLAAGDKVDFKMVTAGGTAKRISLFCKYTLGS